jgi:hypothetical protein
MEAAIAPEKPDFGSRKLTAEAGFYEAAESAFGRLEKPSKNLIYSITCCWSLCARRMAPFMA